MVGWALVAVGVLSVSVQAGAIGPIVKALGEKRALFFGIAWGSTAFMLYGFAWRPAIVFVAIAFAAFWGVWNAAAQSMLSKASPRGAGQLQGALASVRAAARCSRPRSSTAPSRSAWAAAEPRSPARRCWSRPRCSSLALPFALAGDAASATRSARERLGVATPSRSARSRASRSRV